MLEIICRSSKAHTMQLLSAAGPVGKEGREGRTGVLETWKEAIHYQLSEPLTAFHWLHPINSEIKELQASDICVCSIFITARHSPAIRRMEK